MSKIMIIDGKMNSVVIESNQHTLKALGIKPENVKNHKSRRQLNNEITQFIDNFVKNSQSL